MKPLKGIKVIDFTSSISGPYCGALLADYGADVYKLERPGRGEDSRLFPPRRKACHWASSASTGQKKVCRST